MRTPRAKGEGRTCYHVMSRIVDRVMRLGPAEKDRFKSVLVEDGRALEVMTAYIEYNPVRAGIVRRPEEYRWCGRWRDGAAQLVAPEPEGPDPEAAMRALEAGEALDQDALMLCRVRYFSDGLAFGSQAFVDGVFRNNRSLFGARRQDGARPMRRAALDGLFVARDLRLEGVSASPVLKQAVAGSSSSG